MFPITVDIQLNLRDSDGERGREENYGGERQNYREIVFNVAAYLDVCPKQGKKPCVGDQQALISWFTVPF